MDSFFIKLNNLINDIRIPDQFANNEDSLDYIADYFYKYFPDAYYSTGATKVAFIIPEADYVVKIPFNGFITNEDDDFFMEELENADGAEIDLGYGDYFIPFSRASEVYGDGSNTWNYCANEVGYYNDAVNAGYKEFFADTRFYGYSKDHYPIYIQEKVCPVCDGEELEPSEKSQNEAFKMRTYDLELDSPTWLANAIDYYSKEKVEDFINYLATCGVSDLHEGNIGYTKDYKPVLLDWSGYYEDD